MKAAKLKYKDDPDQKVVNGYIPLQPVQMYRAPGRTRNDGPRGGNGKVRRTGSPEGRRAVPVRVRKKRKVFWRLSFPIILIAGVMTLSLLIVRSEFTAIPAYKPSNISFAAENEEGYQDGRITAVDSQRQIQQRENKYLILVNQSNVLASSYRPENMVDIQKQVPSLQRAILLERTAAEAYKAMVQAMEADGVEGLVAVSGYRTYEQQENLLKMEVEKNLEKKMSRTAAEEAAAKLVAAPGSSEHQTGLALDVSTASLIYKLSEEFEHTECYQWLKENCARFGFVIRYPEDKTELTGISHEPWHLRYVGEDPAGNIMSKGLCLEEYLK